MAENAEYKVSFPLQVRFRDTDAMGHVNNAVYLSYLELARMEYWSRVMGSRDYHNVDFILVHASIDYRSPALVHEALEIAVRVSEMRRSSFTMDYRIVEVPSGRLIVEARTVLACYDYKKGKVKRLEEETRRAMAEFENNPELFSGFSAVEKRLDEGGEG